jgi:PAS domain S-box-containing protein
MTAYVYHRRQAVIYKDLYRAEIESAEIKGWFRATLYSIGDGVITTDVSGRVKDMNPVAERLTGWRETDAKGKRLPEVFQTVDEITQMPVPCPADRVLQDGFAVELSNHTMLVSLDGRKCPIADSAAPIRDEDGKTTGVVVVFRDQSKEREADESLRQSEARLRRAELTSGSGNWEFRLDSQIVVVSEGAQKIYGVNNGWLTYDDIRTIPLPEYQPLLDKALDDLVHHDRPYDVEFKIRAVDTGETKDLHSVAVFDHETGALVGVIQDVSGQKRAEEEMRISRQMLRDVLDSVPVRVFWKDANSRYLGCNLAFARDFGFDSVEDIVGKVDFQLSTREFAERYRASDRKVLETGESQLAYEEPRLFPGGIRWVRTSKVPLKNALGEIDGVLGTYEDITERRQEREELRESEEKFRGLVEGSAAAIWIHDTKKFIYANPAAAEITGHTVEELYRLSPFDIVHPDFREMVMRRSEDRIGGKDTPKHYEYQILHKSGRPIWIDFSGSIIYKQGRPVIIASAYDITERKALEDRLIQSQKMEGIGRLAGGIAHDYNNMLGVIMGYTQLLAKKVVGGEPASHYLELISSAAKRGAEMTRQLLAFARREIVSPKPIDPNAAITSIKKMIENLIGEDIELRFLPGKPLWNIKIDPTQFDQILLNLATNARDAIKGVGTITIETTNVVIGEEYSRTRIGASPGEYVKLSFSDTGQGMPKDTLDKIFEPFFTTKPKGEGTGLGLSTVYGIVHQNGGEIDVYSEVGHGTTFKVYLPRYYGELENPEIQLDRTPVTGHATILIVEDQPRLVELFKEFLENFGYRVLTAVSPDEALSICEDYEGEIDLLLTDVVMPGMNGKELKDRVRILKPEVKTLFMSGYTADVIAQRGILDEGVEFLQKPFTPDELARKVADVLKS